MTDSYDQITERMRDTTKLKNDSAIAKVLNITPQALSNYKKRSKMPTSLIIKFANIYNLSVDWLISGYGNVYKPTAENDTLIAAEITSEYGKPINEDEAKVLASFSSEEMIYIGKLLKILRGENESAITAIECNIDSFLKSLSLQEKSKKESSNYDSDTDED